MTGFWQQKTANRNQQQQTATKKTQFTKMVGLAVPELKRVQDLVLIFEIPKMLTRGIDPSSAKAEIDPS
jgi:hypothetical protein